jgi:transcriptional regulator with XRE-family HTH domain
MLGRHVDTQGITASADESIPPVSDTVNPTVYPLGMVWSGAEFKKWGNAWGKRYRIYLRSKNRGLKDVAEAMDLAESTLRSFTNGTRSPSLVEFLTMCQLAEADPATILFGSPTVNDVALQHHKEWMATPHAPAKEKVKEARKRAAKATT